MDEPLVVASIISLISLSLSAVITGTFAYTRLRENSGGGIAITNGLLETLATQTRAMSDLMVYLREINLEARNEHREMIKALTVLCERTSKGCSEEVIQ
jgi:hypothetical protein